MLVCESKDAERYFSGKNNSTKKKVAALDKEIEKLVEERNKLRSKCKHVNAVHKYCGSTGNWSKSDDCYWIEYLCYDCGKVWSTEQ
jgi:cell division protein FtsB